MTILDKSKKLGKELTRVIRKSQVEPCDESINFDPHPEYWWYVKEVAYVGGDPHLVVTTMGGGDQLIVPYSEIGKPIPHTINGISCYVIWNWRPSLITRIYRKMTTWRKIHPKKTM